MKLDFTGLNILTIGDVMLDEYAIGEVKRISPEAPIPVFLEKRTEYRLGGAANVALNIATLGAKSHLLSITGLDKSAEILRSACERNNINHTFIEAKERPTTVKKRFIAKGQQLLRSDKESVLDISNNETQKLLEAFNMIADGTKIDAVILQDYNKGLLTPAFSKRLITICKSQEIPVFLDPKFQNLAAFSGVNTIKPNIVELENALNRSIPIDPMTLEKAVEEFKQIVSFEYCYITLGSKGIYSAKSKQIKSAIPAEVLDVTGAGDAVISILVLASLKGYSEDQKMNLCNLAGAAVCERQGSYGVSIEDIKQKLASPN